MPCKVNNHVDSRMSIDLNTRSLVLPSKVEVESGGTLEPSQIEKYKEKLEFVNEKIDTAKSRIELRERFSTKSSEESDPEGSQSSKSNGEGLAPQDYMLTRDRTKRKVKPNRKFALAECLSYALVSFQDLVDC